MASRPLINGKALENNNKKTHEGRGLSIQTEFEEISDSLVEELRKLDVQLHRFWNKKKLMVVIRELPMQIVPRDMKLKIQRQKAAGLHPHQSIQT